MNKPWNRCDACGQFISMKDFENGTAIRQMSTPDSDYSVESYETLCAHHSSASVLVEDLPVASPNPHKH